MHFSFSPIAIGKYKGGCETNDKMHLYGNVPTLLYEFSEGVLILSLFTTMHTNFLAIKRKPIYNFPARRCIFNSLKMVQPTPTGFNENSRSVYILGKTSGRTA